MKRKAKFQEGGEVRSAIGNEPVGARLRRAFQQGPSQRPAREPSGTPAGQRPTEDRARMAAEAAAEFDREEADLAARAAARRQERANRPSRITNEPVGERLGGRERPAPATTRRPASGANFPGEIISEAAPIADYEERMRRGALPAGRSAAPGPMGQYEESAAAGSVARPRPRPRPAPARPRGPMRQGTEPEGTEAAADAERERQREAAPSRGFFERLGLRRTNETGEGRPSTGNFREDIRELGRTLGFKKGGMIKPKGHGMKEEAMEMKGGRYRGGMKEEMAEMGPMRKKGPMPMMKKGGKVMKYREGGPIRQGMQSPKAQEGRAEMAEDVMRRERAREPISDKERKAGRMEARMDSGPLTDAEKERMRSSGFKKGGAIKPPAKKMKSGGKVPAPKKMMKGGKVAAKPVKKMMGGGRAMYAKGGMAKGCK